MIEDLIIYGAVSSAVYALLALGFTLIYGVSGVLNMSHGALYMLGAYMFSYVLSTFVGLFQFGGPPPSIIPVVSIILAAIFIGFVSIIAYRIIHPVIREQLSVLVITLAVALVLRDLVILNFGASHTAVPRLLPSSSSIVFLGVTITSEQVLAIVLSFSLIAVLGIFVTKSKIGKAMRAIAQDREAAMLMGINTEKLYMLTMFISASLAAIAGISTFAIYPRPSLGTTEDLWVRPLVMSFAIVILGGLGSIKGGLVGAFIVGYAENAVVFLIPEGSYLKGAVALAVMVLVLLIRPTGLFGRRLEVE